MPPDKNDDQPGELLRLLRNLKGIKQGDAASKLGVKQQAISKLEHCKKISAKKFEKIITAFKFSEEEIEAAKKYLPPPPPIIFNKALLPTSAIATPYLRHSKAILSSSEATGKGIANIPTNGQRFLSRGVFQADALCYLTVLPQSIVMLESYLFPRLFGLFQ